MSNGNLTRFLKRVTLKASPQQAYNAWTTMVGLENWFLRKAVFTSADGTIRKPSESAMAGDEYYWLWHGYGDETFEKRSVLEANGKDRFSFQFTGDCIVNVSITTEQGETICSLLQEKIPPDNDFTNHLYLRCGEGWTFYMANLKSMLEGGIDLRNKNPKIREVINA